MKRLIFFEWIRHHKIATLMPAMLAASRGRRSGCFVGMPAHRRRLAIAVASRQSAETCLERSQLAEAERECGRAIEIFDLLAMRSRDPRVRFEQAAALETMALIQSAADRPDQANVFFRKAIPLWAKLLGDNQADSTVRWRLARCLARSAALLSEAGRWEEAERTIERADAACETRLRNVPSDERIDREWVLIKHQLGRLSLRTDRPALALEQFESAVSIQQTLMRAPSSSAEDLELLISLLGDQAKTYSAIDQPAAALGKLAEGRAIAERLTALHPSTVRYQDLLATLIEREAAVIGGDASKRGQGRELLVRAVAIREALAARSPDEPLCVEKLATIYGKLAEECMSASAFAEAEQYERKAVSCRSKLLNEHPGVLAYRFGSARALHNLADLLRQRGRGAEALSFARQAAPLLAAVHRENLLDALHRQAASSAYWSLCTLELDQKDHRAAAAAVSALQAIEPRGFEEAHESAGFLCRCVALCRDDHGSPAAEREKLARSYADRAIAALETAVRSGFRDRNELANSRVYDPLRNRADFARVLREVAEIDQALKEG